MKRTEGPAPTALARTLAPTTLARTAGPTTLAQTLAQLAAAAACVLVLARKWPTLRDFVRAIDHGDLFFADFVHHYYPTVAHSLREGAPAGGFFYPAAFAAMLAPLGLLSERGAVIVWALVQLACLAAVGGWLVREAARQRPALAVLGAMIAVTSIPILHDLKWGQVSLPIVAAVGAAFVLRERGRGWPAAALLAVAAGVKGYPLVFLGYFALRGDLRFVLRAGAACAVTLIALPAIVMGPSHALFFQRVSTSSVLGAADGVLRDFNSQYAPAVLARYGGGWDATAAGVRAIAELASFGVLAMVAALTVVVARSTSPRIAEQRALLGFTLIASTVPFWLRTSWSHYFAHLPVAQVLLARALSDRPSYTRALAMAVFVAPSVFLSSVLGLFATEGWWYYANAGSLLFADVLVLLGCAFVIVEAHVREGAPITRSLFEALARRKRASARAS